jgi:hypothetical protein
MVDIQLAIWLPINILFLKYAIIWLFLVFKITSQYYQYSGNFLKKYTQVDKRMLVRNNKGIRPLYAKHKI